MLHSRLQAIAKFKWLALFRSSLNPDHFQDFTPVQRKEDCFSCRHWEGLLEHWSSWRGSWCITILMGWQLVEGGFRIGVVQVLSCCVWCEFKSIPVKCCPAAPHQSVQFWSRVCGELIEFTLWGWFDVWFWFLYLLISWFRVWRRGSWEVSAGVAEVEEVLIRRRFQPSKMDHQCTQAPWLDP